MTDLLPTFTCFDDALELIAERLKEEPYLLNLRTMFLVHGICLASEGPRAGQPYAHAWVEEQGKVWASCILDGQHGYYCTSGEDFYAAMQVQETTRYTAREALLENARSGHYGPWRPEYRRLCSADRRITGRATATYTGPGDR